MSISGYIRSIVQSSNIATEVSQDLLDLSQAFKAAGNEQMCLKLQSARTNVLAARNIMNTAVEDQLQDQIYQLKKAPLAQVQDMGASDVTK